MKAGANDSSINFKKDIGSDLFTLTISDPDGIQEFSLSPVAQFRYGGLLSGCNKSFSSGNISFMDPVDFKPVMPAYVIDCKNNTTELEIPPPIKGSAKSVLVKKEIIASSPQLIQPSLPPRKEEKKEGPLSVQDIQYPVPGLGNCQNEIECRSYCDNADRAKECFAFAKKYNLISAEETKKATDRFLNVKNGPGGCNSGASCEAYCNNIDHLDACISFAEDSGYYSGEKLAEAKKIQGLVKSGKQFPGGCKDRNTCEIYCGDPNHMEECLNFAESAGFMPKEEIEQARKILPLMKRGETPGKCTSKEQCEQYCFEESHNEECIAFGERVGLISPEDAVMIKKSGGKGPGGCRSKEQCEAYCENNSDACFQWAQDNGSFSEADLAKMKKGMAQFKDQLDKMPPEVTACLKDALGEKNFDKMVSGKPIFDRSMEGKMKSCFNQLTSQVSKQFSALPPEATQCIKDIIGEEGLRKIQSGELDQDIDFSSLEGCFQKLQSSFGGGSGGPGGPGGFSGPGGCKSIDECTAYCMSHPDACKDFAPPGGGVGGGPGGGFPGGPGGCKSVEECTIYCKDNPDECKDFSFPGGSAGGFPGGGATGGAFPGGCKNQEECIAYCKDHPEECKNNSFPGSGGQGGLPGTTGGFPSGGSGGGPGGCISKEECMTYCTTHYTDPSCAPYIGGGAGGTPSGCTSQADCQVYCQTHYTDPVCTGGGAGGGGGTPYPTPPYPSGTPYPTQTPPLAQSCVVPPSGLAIWLNGDSLSEAVGGVTSVSGKVGNAFKFDGSSGYIKMGNPANLNFGTGPFSLEAWFNWNGGGNSGALNIIRKSNYPVSGSGSGYWVRIGKDSKTIEFSVGATTGPEGQSIITTPISSGAWHHVAAIRDSSGAIKLYINGESQGTVLRQATSADSTSEAPFTVGAWDDRFGITEFFPGMIDEVSVYNRALSSSEVQAIAGVGSAGKCSAQSPTPSPSSQATPDYCSSFISVPSCSYVGAPDSQNYKYCKECYPNK